MIVDYIEVIALFNQSEQITPLKFSFTDENEYKRVVKVDKILKRDYNPYSSNKMWKFNCLSIIDNREIQYVMKYDIENNKWLLLL